MAILEVEHICKSFNRTEVLKDINFSLEKGQAVSIIGSDLLLDFFFLCLVICLLFCQKLPGQHYVFQSRILREQIKGLEH